MTLRYGGVVSRACTAALLAAPLLLLQPVASMAAEVYVAPNGSDANPGTQERPLATLEKARDAARALKAEGAVTVTLRGGTFTRQSTFALGKEDSGTKDARVTYRAFGDEEVRLSGGRTVPGAAFRPVTDAALLRRLPEEARGKVFQVDLKEHGVTDFGAVKETATTLEVFVNGRVMTLARWPNTGYVKTGPIIDRGTAFRFYAADITPNRKEYTPPEKRDNPYRPGVFEYSGDRPARWTGAKDAWMFGYWALDWADECVRLARVDTEKRQIHADRAHGYGYSQGQRYYVFNLLEEIDLPGEWYLDKESGTLYLYPPCPIAGAIVEVSVLSEPLVTLTDASCVTLQGLTFETTRGGGIAITGGTENLVAACTFRRTGKGAVSVSGGTGHGVAACDVYDTNGGISLSGGDRKTLAPAGHYAENNHLRNYARIKRTYNAAISLGGVGCRASYNRVHEAPHMAIGFGGNDHVIEFNELFDVCRETSDAGVIYTGRDWTMRGNVIRHNFIHDITGIGGIGAFGVYLDDCFSSAEVVGNVFYRMKNNAFHIGGGRDNVIENNVLVETGPIAIDDRGLGWGKPGVLPGGTLFERLKDVPYREEPWKTRYPRLPGILEDDPGCPKGNVVRRNLFVRSPEPRLAKPVVEFGTIADNWRTEEDPGFVDAAGLNFALREASVVFEKIPGFQPVPLEKIGLRVDAYRKQIPPHAPEIAPGAHTFVEEAAVALAAPRSPGAVIRYTLDGTPPTASSPRYTAPVVLRESCTLTAGTFMPGAERPSAVASADYTLRRLGPGNGIPLGELAVVDEVVHGGLKRDVNYRADGPIRLGGKVFARGLLIHPKGAEGYAVFSLAGGLSRAKRLKATIGVDESVTANGSVTFIVEVRRDGEWKRVFESGVFRAGKTPPQAVDVEVGGGDQLRLRTTDAGDGASADHAAWGDPVLE